jgi:hypothetical protein
MLFGSPLCFGFVNFASNKSKKERSVRGKEIKNYNGVSHEPKANKEPLMYFNGQKNQGFPFWDWSSPNLKLAFAGLILLTLGFLLGSLCMKYTIGNKNAF